MREDEARRTLDRANALGHRVRGGGRWLALYCAVFGVGTLSVVLTTGMASHGPLRTAVMAVFGIMVLVLVVWAATRPVSPRRFVWLHTAMILGWAVLYSVALLVGRNFFPGEPAWWVPMAVATALPPWALTVYTLRTAGRQR